MHTEELERYISKSLDDLDKQKDMQELIRKGKLSFGIDSTKGENGEAVMD